MADYITKPSADAVTDLSNAEEHLSVSASGSLNVGGAGTFDVYVAIAGTVSVTTSSGLTAANDGDEAEFFYTGSPGGNIGITIGSGTYAGTYTTDHAGGTFTLADVQSAPVCLVKPSVSGSTGDGDTLTVTPSIWIYDGPTITPLTRQQKLDGVDVPIGEGGDALTFLIDLAQYSAQDFTVDETWGGTTVSSNTVTLDTFGGSYMALDANSKFWFDPAQVNLDGSNNFVSWPNTATGGSSAFDLDTVYGSQLPTWDVANSKLVGNGSNAGVQTGSTGDDFTIDGGYSVFIVADASTGSSRTNSVLFSYGNGNQYVHLGAGRSGGNLQIYVRDNSFADGIGFGSDPPRTLNNTIAAGKHLIELRVTGETLAEIYVNGRLEWSQVITEANSLGTILSLLSGGNGTWFSDAAIYEAFCTLSTGAILNNIRSELATKHSITLL